jgi:hypothetical protein
MSRRVVLLFGSLLFAACAAPAEIREVPEPTPAPAAAHPSYETFDPSAYDAQPPPRQQRTEVVHDAPAQLLEGTVAVVDTRLEEPRVIQGFRIQLFTSESKPAADAIRDQAMNWWRAVQTNPQVQAAFPYGMPTAVIFARPSYRVRVGAFPDRDSAQEALELLRQQFPEAFLVPDTVTLE